MITPGTPITLTDLTSLATLANSKLSPSTPYSFPAFAGKGQIGLPDDIAPVATYGSGSFTDGSKVTLWLYGYKTISGTKTYTWTPLVKAFYAVSGSGVYTLTWTWVSVTGTTAPDGYIAVVPVFQSPGWHYQWKDIGNVQTLTEDGTFLGWNTDQTLQQDVAGSDDLPCGQGAWLKPLNSIWRSSMLLTDIGCNNSGNVTGLNNVGGIDGFVGSISPIGIAALVSGPWCVAAYGGSTANVLTSWVIRPSIYYQTATIADTLFYTQCYRSVKFYFRSVDAPSGVNITAQNGLTAFVIGSEPLLTTTAHFHLRIISCSDGHILVQDSGGGTIRTDMDVTAGMTYDISFDIGGLIADGSIIPWTLDFTFTTAAATGAGTPTPGIELNNDVNSIAVPDSYCEIEFNNPMKNISGFYIAIQLCTTCLKMALTENNKVPGVWAANTLPTLGVMPYLDQDLPQYNPQPSGGTLAASSRRQPISDTNPVQIPHVDNRGALWPIFRDTDFAPDSVFGQPYDGSLAWRTSIATKLIEQATVSDSVPPSGLLETLFIIASPFVTADAADLKFLNEASGMTIYLKFGGFPNISDFDVSAPSGSWQSLAALLPGFSTDGQWFIGLLNPSPDSLDTVFKTVIIDDATLPNGTFFPTLVDDDNNRVAQTEGYSYHFSDTATDLRPIPLLGYCVYSLTVRRQPVDNGAGVFLAPSTGTNALNVDIGTMQGFGWGVAGTFTKIQTVTIPAGQASVTTDVFLPVLSGTPLAYQCTEQVQARAAVNFQPLIHSKWLAETVKVNGVDYNIGFYNGQAWFNNNYSLLTFVGTDIAVPILLPVSASVYNDLESVLNLLP